MYVRNVVQERLEEYQGDGALHGVSNWTFLMLTWLYKCRRLFHPDKYKTQATIHSKYLKSDNDKFQVSKYFSAGTFSLKKLKYYSPDKHHVENRQILFIIQNYHYKSVCNWLLQTKFQEQ